jgi:flagellin-like protein
MTRIKNVRNTTKFKRSIKAISPVIATLLMIAIAVVASLVVYAWVTGYMGNATSKAGKAIQIQSFASQGGNLVIYVQNVGQGDVELDKDQSVYVNSNLVSFNSATQRMPLSVGQTVELQTNAPYTDGTKVNIKVTTTDGTFMTTTGTGTGASSTSPSPTAPPGALIGNIDPTGPLTMIDEQTQTFTASSTGGTGSKSYQWYLDSSAVSGEVASTYTYTASSGNHEVYVKVTDSAAPPVSDDSSTVSITVTDALGASIASAGPLTMDAGQQQTFTATATGGTGPYSYAWYLDGSVISGQTALTYIYSASVGSDSIYCRVTDSASPPATADSNTVSITVSAAMTVSVSPAGPMSMTSGQTQVFTSTVTGGTGTKSYQWYLDSSAVTGQTSATYTYTAATGSHNIYLRATDSASTPETAQSNTISITVNSAPQTLTLRPTGTGSVEELDEDYSSLNNWECVDESTSDNDNYYVYNGGSTSYRTDVYGISNHGSETGTILSVEVFVNCRKYGSDSDNSYAETAIRVGSTNTFGSPNTLSGSYQTYNTLYTTKPGGGSWTWTDIDNLQAGVSLRSGDINGWQSSDLSIARCTQVWVVITYNP